MATRLILDIPTVEMVEAPFDFHREAAAIKLNSTHNLLRKWRTGSFTLAPINLYPDFQDTNKWEELKFRLSDVICDTNWWQEVPYNNSKAYGPCDYFFAVKVPSTSVPTDGSSLLNAMVTQAINVIGSAMQFQTPNSVGAILSQQVYPANQGYMLRFHPRGRPAQRKTGIINFRFADYVLQLDGDGQAHLYRTFDMKNYNVVHSFQWAKPGGVHLVHHEIAIVPHARNVIEFLCTGYLDAPFISRSRTSGVEGTSFYRKPDLVEFDNEGTAQITKPGAWCLDIHKEFLTCVQVSRIAFANGDEFPATLYDTPIDPGMSTNYPFQLMPYGDNNGGWSNYRLEDAVDHTEYKSDGRRRRFQFKVTMHGKGDEVCLGGAASSSSPEFYGYSVRKEPYHRWDGRVPWSYQLLKISMDHGSSPEAERLTVTTDNSFGQVEGYTDRPDIPLAVIDDATGVVYFEGRGKNTRANQDKAGHKWDLTIEANGMADALLRACWTWNRPNFAIDPYDPEGRAWYWQAVVRHCFAAAGFDPISQVYFEPVDGTPASQYDFRLWLDGNAGGSNSGSVGSGPAVGGRWYPAQHAPIHEFLDYLLRRIMGWNWYWDRQINAWHIYKRPSPASVWNTWPKVSFWGGYDKSILFYLQGVGVPIYKHRSMMKEAVRAEYTTAIVWGYFNTEGWLTKEELEEEAKKLSKDPSYNSATYRAQNRFVPVLFENPNGFASPDHPSPDVNSPDYLGVRRCKMVPLLNFATREGLVWAGRRIYEDLCFGHRFRTFVSDWGDPYTAYLRKWDKVLIDGYEYLIDRVEPEWEHDKVRRARYRCWQVRYDRPPQF